MPGSAKVMAPRAAAASSARVDLRDRPPAGRTPSRCPRAARSLRATDRRASRDRARAARVCPRSRDERIPPRRAARRWHRVRVRTPAAGRPAGSGPTCRGRPAARRSASRAKNASNSCVAFEQRLLDACCQSWRAGQHVSRSAAADRPPACRSRACLRSRSSRARCRPAARESRR